MPAPSAGMTSELLGRSLRPRFSHREIRAKEVDKCNHDGYGKQYVALIQDHEFIFPIAALGHLTLPLLHPQPHTRRVAIGELDTGFFEHALDRREIIARRHAAFLLEVDDDAGRDHGALSQHALIHIDEAARGAILRIEEPLTDAINYVQAMYLMGFGLISHHEAGGDALVALAHETGKRLEAVKEIWSEVLRERRRSRGLKRGRAT